jgi:flagella basal body P-ring formation protein FlgA
MRYLQTLLFLLVLSVVTPLLAADDWHPHDEIRSAATDAVRLQRGVPGGRVEVVADELDARVRLTRCGEALKVSVPFGDRAGGRITTQVRCAGPAPWKLYVPVRLVLFQPVLVSARALARDSVLQADDFVLQERDTGRLAYGYLARIDDVVGQRLRKAMAPGEVLTPNNLETPPLVKRGQQVTLEARGRGLTVRMAGVAGDDGVRGEVITVKNLRSGEEVQGIVRSAKSVEVLLQ